MARFSQYIDQYPGTLPGDVSGPVTFKSPTDRGSLFERFLALQANPNAVLLERMQLPANFRKFLSMSGNQ